MESLYDYEYDSDNERLIKCRVCSISDKNNLHECLKCKNLFCDKHYTSHIYDSDDRFNFKIFGYLPFDRSIKQLWDDNIYSYFDGDDIEIEEGMEILSMGEGLKVIIKKRTVYLTLK